MYGTVARIRLKPGMESQMLKLLKEHEGQIDGYISSSVYRMDADSNEYYLAVVFKDRDSYHANAQSPEQDQRYRQLAELFEGEPEWHDGEIITAG